tara:strand:+ start:1015 stop:1200 length:186 start_codon:yes stop_codon:yes gene_type:complete
MSKNDNTTTQRSKYVNQWQAHVGELTTLAWCKDAALSKEVLDAVENLKQLVERVADTKNLK